ncbi:MAG: xylulokinase [Thermoprotei archaeon]|nr:MAG: xylulokinase [Thermoprotei archaeon]
MRPGDNTLKVVLGADIGTTNCKVVAFDLNGNRVAEESMEYPTYHPRPLWAEQDPNDWVNAFMKCARKVIEHVKRRGYQVEALCITSQREGVVPVGRNGRPLARCIIWMDERSAPQAERLEERIGREEIYKRTGLRVAPTFTATKLLWIKENQSQIYEDTEIFLQPKEYVNFILTGVACSDPSLASRTMMFNIHKLDWDEDLVSAYGLSLDKMPEVKPSYEVIGYVRDEVARKLGLNKSIPVVNGGGDRPCEALGAGVVEEGILGESTGTATNVMMSANKVLLDPKMRILCSGHVLPKRWLLEGGTTPTGAILRWFRDNIAIKEVEEAKSKGVNPYDIINEEAEKIPPGSEGLWLLPFFMGAKATRWNPYLRGAFIGLTLGHSRSHMARSIMEGIAYLAREIIEVIESLGIKVREIRLLGGAAKSLLWSRIKASIWNKKVKLMKELEAATLGAAILASLGVGLFKNYEEAERNMVKVKEVIEPVKEWIPIYENAYKDYLLLINTLEELMTRIYKRWHI